MICIDMLGFSLAGCSRMVLRPNIDSIPNWLFSTMGGMALRPWGGPTSFQIPPIRLVTVGP